MIQNYNTYRVLQEFFQRPTHRFHLRELSRDLKLGMPSVRSHVHALAKMGLVAETDAETFKSYVPNVDSPLFKTYKRLDTLQRLYDSGLVDFLEKQLSYPTAIILFGSCAYGEDTEKSDIDIAVIARQKELDVSKYERELGRSIQLHAFGSVADMKKTPELFNNIMNGVVLYGFVKVL